MDGTTHSISQAGAIAIREGQICLVTSSHRKRWVIPKGCQEPGKTAAEIALQEAWEEAGLIGELYDAPLGAYAYQKGGWRYQVTVFLMFVVETKAVWPEMSCRTRCWVRPSVALGQIKEWGLRRLIREALEFGIGQR